MGKAHVFHIGDELIPQLVVGEHAAVGVFPPRARVDLIDVHRPLVVGVLLLIAQPVPIVPLVALQLHPAGGRAGPRLCVAGKGVCLVGVLALGGFDVELIQLVGLKDKVRVALPHRVVNFLQGILGLIPIAEIAHQGDLSGVGRPHPGHHARFALAGGLVQAQIFVRTAVFAAAEQVKRRVIRLLAGPGFG